MKIRQGILCVAVCCASWLTAGAAKPPDTPNILLISIDTMRGDALGRYGGDVDTPWMDSLADDGVYFREARAQAPWTLPNFASIYTGLRPYRHAALSKRVILGEEQVTLAEWLKQLGYRTEAHVNADLLTETFGMAQGVDSLSFHSPSWGANFNSKGAELAVQRSFEVFRQPGPWFMHAHFFDAHTPYVTPEHFNKLYYNGNPAVGDTLVTVFLRWTNKQHEREGKFKYDAHLPLEPWLDGVCDLNLPLAQYRGGLAWLDTRVGLLLARLKHLGLYDDCLIVLLSDHGETMGEQDYFFDHILPLDAVLHVPLIIKLPGNKHGGREVKQWVQTMDLLPTLGEYLGLALPPDLDGRSLMPLLKGRRGYRREWFTAEMGEADDNYIKSICDGRWHAIRYHHQGRTVWELYDLAADPDEAIDLSGREPDRLRHLEQQMWQIFSVNSPLIGAQKTERSYMTEQQKKRLKSLGY